MTADRGTVAEYIHALLHSDRFSSQIAAHRIGEPGPAVLHGSPVQLHKCLQDMLTRHGIRRLYRHQDEAITSILQGNHTLVATPTASGKSLIYNLPVFTTLLGDPSAKAIYLFPLKALAQDQLQTINEMAALLSSGKQSFPIQAAAIYDGDTTACERKKIREQPPAVLITNPDMLHLSLLPYHHLWTHFFKTLRYVIIDEVHTYRGIFGSHMAWVLRRLQRICRLYGSAPVFVLSSATIGNPGKFGEALIDAPVGVITQSGAPRPARDIVLLNPVEHPGSTATMLLQAACSRELRTIVYTQSRKMTELVTMWSQRRLGAQSNKIASYRAGFLAEERRAIENKLHSGELLGVISTSALELGIDIGSLDICILLGYPGSMMATWQRAGRVGRSGRESLVILIAQEDALDQYFMRRPEDFFQRPVEPVVLNPFNPHIASAHLHCAAAETPLLSDEPLIIPATVRRMVDDLTERGLLLRSADGATWFAGSHFPQRQVNLRGGGEQFLIRLEGSRKPLGEIDGSRVFKDCHAGAIYLHGARPYHVISLDLEAREVLVSPAPPAFFTKVQADKETTILHTAQTKRHQSAVVHLGLLRVTERVTGYQKILAANRKIIGTYPLDLPPHVMETEGIWLEIPEELRLATERQQLHFMGGIHAMEHAIIGLMPLHVLCDRNDIGGISQTYHDQVEGAAVFIYDGHAGGIGLCSHAFERVDALLQETLDAVKSCPCELGCPSCVHSPRCGSGNRPIDKMACLHILEKLLTPATSQVRRRAKTKAGQQPAKDLKTGDTHSVILPRFGVLDVETRRSAAEVGGWRHADRMGVSVAVLYDAGQDRFLAFQEQEIDQLLQRLFDLELIVGFNNKGFDNKVLAAYSRRPLGSLPSLDLLEVITSRLGYRLSLDRLAQHTLGVQKSGSGLQALQWFQEGKMDLLTDYCQRDVRITRDLFLYGLQHRYWLFENKAGKVVRLPVNLQDTINALRTRAGSGKGNGTRVPLQILSP